MVALAAVSSGQASLAAHVNQYRDLFRGGFVYDVVAGYGADPTGVADSVAAIQAAIDAAGAAGGGEVYFPEGTYKLTAYTNVDWAFYHLLVRYSGITFRGAGMASVISAATNIIPFLVFKNTLGPANWDFAFVNATVYPMGAAAAGAGFVTLTTPGQAANFVAGDYIFIRTGQTIAGDTKQPDAEINQVDSVNAGTGVITLRWPLAKPYAQEYFISGTTGKTSTTPTANPASFGVANVTAYTLTGLAFRDLRFLVPGNQYLITGVGVIGLTVEGCSGLFGTGPLSWNHGRGILWARNRFEYSGAGVWSYAIGLGTGCSDVEVVDNINLGQHTMFAHFHEGCAHVAMRGNTFASAATATSAGEQNISVRGRAYDVNITDNVLSGGVGVGLYVDPDCGGGGVIAQNVIKTAGTGISVEAPNWLVRDNVSPGGEEYVVPLLTPHAREQLSGWVKFDNQTVLLGTLPRQCVVLAVYVAQWTPFNGSGTDLLSVGTDANNTLYASGVDVSLGYRLTTPAMNGLGWEPSDVIVKAFYTNGGGEPTAGTCCVMIEYVRVSVGSN